MKIVVGLGNPGREYECTRHNAGFMLVDALAVHWGAGAWRGKFDAQVAEVRIGAEQVLLMKPQTYMNLSGSAVGQAMRWYKLAVGDVVAVYDDMDIPVGTAKLKRRGSSGGHRGVESLLVNLGSEEFARIKIGVGRPPVGWTVVDHVLASFQTEEKSAVDEIITKLLPAAEYIVREGIDKAMNRYVFKNPVQKKTTASSGEAIV